MKCSNCGYVNAMGANSCAQCNQSLGYTPYTSVNVPPQAHATPTPSAVASMPSAVQSTVPTPTPSTSTPGATAATASSPTNTGFAQTNATVPTQAAAYAPNPIAPASANPDAAAHYAPQARPYTPPSYPSPYPPYQSVIQKPKQPFTLSDACIIIGFVLAVIGVFTYSIILLPASIVFSVVGYIKRNNSRTLGLSISAIVVSIVACLIRLATFLDGLGFIPSWLRDGIFS